MKIKEKLGFYLTSTGFGGLELNALNLAKWMSDRGWEVHFYTIARSRIYERCVELDLNVSPVAKPNKYIDLKNGFRLSRLLKTHQVEKLIVFDNHDLSTANFCKQFFLQNLNMIYLQQMQFKVKKTSPAHTFRFSGLNYWISPLPSLKGQVLKTTKVPESKIKVIPLCLETKRFTENALTKDDALQELNLDPDNKYIGVIGRIAPTKGQLGVIRAFNELSDKYPKWHLLIMGEPTINEAQCIDYDNECKAYVKEHGLESRVHFRAFRKEVEYFYASVDVFIMSSKKETYGMVTIEAMLSEIPVIGTKSGGTIELLENGTLGQLYKFDNDLDLASKIENIILEKFNWQDMIKKARKTSILKYDANIMCQSIEELLK